jgi:hypothetical protein
MVDILRFNYSISDKGGGGVNIEMDIPQIVSLISNFGFPDVIAIYLFIDTFRKKNLKLN